MTQSPRCTRGVSPPTRSPLPRSFGDSACWTHPAARRPSSPCKPTRRRSRAPAGTRAIVKEHALLRRLIGVAHEIAEIGYELPVDVAGALDQAESMVFDVAQRRSSDSVRSLKDLLTESLERLEDLYDRGETITGVPTGYGELDHLLAGLQPSNLVVVGARPSMGKTAFALGLATHAASNHGVPVLFFSLEMSHLEIAQRVLSAEARLDVTKLRNGRLLDSDWPKISSAIGRIDTAPLFIDDNPNVTVMDIRAKARRMKVVRRHRPRRHRLSPAHDGPVVGGEPPGRDLRDLPRSQDPGARAAAAGRGAQPAVARSGGTGRQAPDARGSPRVPVRRDVDRSSRYEHPHDDRQARRARTSATSPSGRSARTGSSCRQ